jgi:peroxiredoxin Q/BCP
MDVGDIVEDFELPDERGVPRKLSTLLTKGPVVVFFYPAALSLGCTAEACHFRDVTGEFRAAGGQPVGISGDSVDRQAAFAEKHSLGYPLLSDEKGTVRDMFGVMRGGAHGALMPTRRATFVIDTDRRVLEVIRSEIRMNVHADRALAALRRRED